MLVPTLKLIANSESASKSRLEKPEDEISQPHTDLSLTGEECDFAPRTAIDFQSREFLFTIFLNTSICQRTRQLETQNDVLALFSWYISVIIARH
jgi:hypothetical protein